LHPNRPIPFIGQWLYRKRVQKMAHWVRNGDVAAVRELAAIFSATDSPGCRIYAEDGLRSLSSPEQADALCREVLMQNIPDLTYLAQDCGYLPSDPGDRAFFLFCIQPHNECDIREEDSKEELLAQGYLMADTRIRAWICDTTRANGKCTALARALCSPGMPGPAARSYGEWEIVIAGLSHEKMWEELWQQVVLAPLPLAVKAVAAMKTDEWTPPGDDRLVWEGIIATLPERWTYPSPAGKLQPVFCRPAAQVSRLAFSPDGSLLATGCCDGQIPVWRTASPGLAGEISCEPGAARFLSISSNNRYIVSCREGGSIQCDDLQESVILWSQKTGFGEVMSLFRSDDDRILLAGDDQGTLHLLDPLDGRLLKIIPLHPSPVTCLDISPDGTAAACGHADGTLSVARIGDETVQQMHASSPDPIRSVVFSTTGNECLVVHDRAFPVLWDIATRSRLRVFSGHAGRAACCAVSAKSGWFVIGSDDHTIRFWEWQNSGPAAVVPLYNRHVTCCSAAPDGRLLATGLNDGTIRLFGIPNRRLVREYKGHQKAITACAVSPDGSRLATVSWDGTTKLWRLPEGEIVRTLDTHAGGIAALVGPGGGSLIAAVTEDGIARVHEGTHGSLIRTLDLYTPSVRAAAMSTDGMYLACTGADATLRIWNIRNGSLVTTSRHLATSQRCCTFLSGGSSLFCGGWDGKCRIFSIPEGRLEKTLAGHTSIVTCCAGTGDGTILVTGSNDTTVRIWKPGKASACRVLDGSRTEIGAVAISPDGTLLAAGGADAIIRLYRLPTGKPAGELPGIPGKVTTLVFDSEGCILAAGYDSGICAYYAVPDRKLIRTVAAHAGAVTGIVVLSDEKLLVTSGKDGICRFHPLPVSGFLPGATLADLPFVRTEAEDSRESPDELQWTFLYRLLAARFRGEIQICPSPGNIGCYDIQIVG
jgi:WD40 repeat protein